MNKDRWRRLGVVIALVFLANQSQTAYPAGGFTDLDGDPADFSAAFRALGITDAKPGYGRLMAMPVPSLVTA